MNIALMKMLSFNGKKQLRFRPSSRCRGSSMLLVLFLTIFTSGALLMQLNESRNDRFALSLTQTQLLEEQFRNYVLYATNCHETLKGIAAVCAGGTVLALKDSLGDSLKTDFAGGSIRAVCTGILRKFRIEYRFKTNGWRDLFKSDMRLQCAAYLYP